MHDLSNPALQADALFASGLQVIRMRWARAAAGVAFAEPVVESGPPAEPGQVQVVRCCQPADEVAGWRARRRDRERTRAYGLLEPSSMMRTAAVNEAGRSI
jgi:hypothetical protein